MKGTHFFFFVRLFGVSFAWWDRDIGSADENTDPLLVYRSYVRAPYCSPSSRILHPESVEEIQQLVKRASLRGETLKALGQRHSKTDVICTDGTPISMEKLNGLRLNSDLTVTVGAGTMIGTLVIFLQDNQRGLPMVPKYQGITVAGAIGTGAHGSTLKHPPTISDQVVSLKAIDGLGEVRTIEGEELKAWRIHLGLLGIVVEVTLTTVPLYKVKMTRTKEPDSVLTDGSLLARARNSDMIECQWLPNQGVVGISESNYVDISTPGDSFDTLFVESTPESANASKNFLDALQQRRAWNANNALEQLAANAFYTQVAGNPPRITDDGVHFRNPGVGIYWRMMGGQCFNCSFNMGDSSYYFDDDSIAIDARELPAAVETIRAILKQERMPSALLGVPLRFLKESEAMMSFTSGRKETVVIELVSTSRIDPFNTPKFGLAAYQAVAQALLRKHDGRPHLGKNGFQYLSRDVLKHRTPRRMDFAKAMKKYDPSGVFLNKFGRRLLGLSTHMDIDPLVKHCALESYCICENSADCAPEQICTSLTEGSSTYDVCKNTGTYPDPPLIPYDPMNRTSVMAAVLVNLSS